MNCFASANKVVIVIAIKLIELFDFRSDKLFPTDMRRCGSVETQKLD